MKIKRKTFKCNNDYFEFYNKMKDKIKLISIRILDDKVTIIYSEVVSE